MEAVVASFKVKFRHFPGGTHENSQSGGRSVSRPRFEFCTSLTEDRNFTAWVNLPGNFYCLRKFQCELAALNGFTDHLCAVKP
jgi:hypothetical protein